MARWAQVVVVQEGPGPDLPDHGQEIQAREPLVPAELRDPLLHQRRGRARLHLEAEREHHEREARPVGDHLEPQRADLLEEPRERLAHALRIGLGEQPLHPVDLALLGTDQEPHQRQALVERHQPARRSREVVLQLRDVVEADREHGLVRLVCARDPLPRGPLLARRPAPERDVHDFRSRPGGHEVRLEQLRVGLLPRELRPERHAVAEERDPPIPPGALLVRVRSRSPSALNSSHGGQPTPSDFIT